MDYIEFVKEYRDLACRYADAAICRHVQKHGALNSRIDVDLVKDLAVETALSKVFYNYDPERAKKANAQFSTFLNKVVNNCVLNELSSEGRALKRGGLLNGHETALDNSTPGAGESVNDWRFFEPHTYNAWERGISCRQRYKLNEMVMTKLSMLPESDKILIDCLLYSFSHPDTNYIDLYIEKMGLTDVKRNAIEVRKRRALDRLKKLLGGRRPDYHDIYVSLRRSYDNADDTSDTMPYLPEDGMLGYNGMRKRMSSMKSSYSASDLKRIADDIVNRCKENTE